MLSPELLSIIIASGIFIIILGAGITFFWLLLKSSGAFSHNYAEEFKNQSSCSSSNTKN